MTILVLGVSNFGKNKFMVLILLAYGIIGTYEHYGKITKSVP
jgi:hypothetical protein